MSSPVCREECEKSLDLRKDHMQGINLKSSPYSLTVDWPLKSEKPTPESQITSAALNNAVAGLINRERCRVSDADKNSSQGCTK